MMNNVEIPREYADLFGDIPPDDFGSGETQYPQFQWCNGDPKLSRVFDISYTGGWFLPEIQAPTDQIPGAPAWDLVTESDEHIPGFAAFSLRVAIISYRRAWTVASTGSAQQFPWTQFSAAKNSAEVWGTSPRGRVHVLVGVEGLLDYGPFVLSAKGMCGKALVAAAQEVSKILKTPTSRIVREERKDKAHPGVPLRAFWVQVGYAREENGKPRFLKVGSGDVSSLITPPAPWDLPAKPVKAWGEASPYFVGKENLILFSSWYEDAQEWTRAWDDVAREKGHEASAQQAQHAEIPEDDMPFNQG